MKKKDVTYLVLTVIILLGAGYLAYTQLFKSKTAAASAGTQVEVIGSIPTAVDPDAISQLTDPTKTTDFTPAVDLSGLGNTVPFGQGQ